MPDREHATLRAWKPLWPPICCVEAQAPRRTPRRAKQYGAATAGAKRMVPSRAGGAAAAPQGCSCSWSSSPRSNYRRLSPPTARWGGASSLHYPPGHGKKTILGLLPLAALDPRAGFECGALYDGGNAQFWSAWSGGASCRGCRQDDCVWRLLLDHQGRLPRVLGAVRRAGRVRAHVCTRWPVGLTALSLRSCSIHVITAYVFSCSSVHAHACGVYSRTP